MADGRPDVGAMEQAAADAGAGAATSSAAELAMQLMDELGHKLTLLNYEETFCAETDILPFPPGYFAVQHPSPPLQFQHFLALASFLCGQAGVDFQSDSYDAPAAAVTRLLRALEQVGFRPDFPPMKLQRQTYGVPVLEVLSFLVDRALESSGFSWARPEYPTEEFADEAEADDDAEVNDDDVADLVGNVGAGEDEDDVLFAEAAPAGASAGPAMDESLHRVLETSIDPTAWRAEVERVAGRLRSGGQAGGKEWRSHLEQTAAHGSSIKQLFPDSQSALERIQNGASAALERVGSKEKYLNSTFRALADEYKGLQGRLTTAGEQQAAANKTVGSLTSKLAGLSDALEDTKAQMEDRGSSMSDTSPLVRIKGALARLRQEMKALEVRIGVSGHALMQSKLRDGASGLSRAHRSAQGLPMSPTRDNGDDDFELEEDEEEGSRGFYSR